MNETLIEKMKQLIKQHYSETGEQVSHVSVDWHKTIGSSASVESIRVTLEK